MDDFRQEFTPLEDGAEFSLSVAKSNDAYMLVNKTDGLSADLREDDAVRFSQDYQELKSRSPDWSADQLLAQLWDQGGYGWLAK